MAFITRLSRLMRADLHAMLDRLEAPDLVLAQAVRDMEQALERDTRGLASLEHEQLRLRDQASELGHILTQTQASLEDCLASGQEDLARQVIRRRLELERQARVIGQRLRVLESDGQRRRQRLIEQGRRLEDLRSRAACYEEEQEASLGLDVDAWAVQGDVIRDADVEVALLKAKRQREERS